MKPGGSTERYRPDIDGLRAVAVILVILYHLNHSLAPGGFIGVDIFFVISGFVVTSSILSSRERRPVEAMLKFWRRRILRILPAVLLMVIVATFMLAMISPPFPVENYNSNFRTGISGIFGFANLYLYRSSLDYFSADQSTNPFVHMWSLGVEEQFYFAFALVFIGVLGFIRHHQTRFRASALTILIFGVTSYWAFRLTALSNPSITYYLITFRFWEIAAGSLLAYVDLTFSDALRPKHVFVAASLEIAAVLLLIKAVWFDHSPEFPTGPISLAVVCTALLIVTGKHDRSPSGRILSLPVFVQIGLISYSLYLWHYPVFLFWRVNRGLETTIQISLALLVVGLASVFSYRIVERRLRYSTVSFSTVTLPCLMGVVIVLSGFVWFLQRRPGILYIGSSQQWTKDWDPRGQYAYAGNGRIRESVCNVQNGVVPIDVPDPCFSSTSSEGVHETTLLIVGDSHAYADWGMAASGAATRAFRFATLMYDGCWPGAEPTNRSRSCLAYWKGLPEIIQRTLSERDSVLISLLWESRSRVERDRAEEAIGKVIKAARERGAEVIIEAPLPIFPRPGYLCTKEWYRSNYDGCSVDRSDVERQRSSVMADLKAITEEDRNVRIWDPLSQLCPTETCSEFLDGKPLFRDSSHLSYYGSRWLAPAFVDFLHEPERD
jgi:peptidoglycan/LPS O-acetylase OafA/YrhL